MERILVVRNQRRGGPPNTVVVDGRVVTFTRHQDSGLVVPKTLPLVTEVSPGDQRLIEQSRRRD